MLRRPRAHHVVLAGLVALVAAPVLFGRTLWLRDQLLFVYPIKLVVRARLAAGELPLWNPLHGLGRPLLGMIQPAVLYPLNPLLLLPAPLGVDLFYALHLLVAGLGMRRWLRALDVDDTAATLGAVVLTLSGYLVAMFAGSGMYLAGVAWVPWVLAAGASAAAATDLRARGAVAARVAIPLALTVLAGDPQALYLGAGLVLVQALAQGGGRALVTAGVGVALATLVAAAQILPALEVARVGRPGGVPLADARHFAMHPARLLELVWPGAYGEPHTPGWFVHALVDEGTGQSYEPWCSGIYVGVVTLALAVAAVARRARTRLDVALAALALVGLLLAFGTYAPFWEPFFRFVPGAKQFRYPEKYFFVSTLALCALGARGLATVAAAPARAMRAGAVLVVVLLAGAIVASVGGPALARGLVGRLGQVTPEAAGGALAGAAWTAFAVGVAAWLPVALAARGRVGAARMQVALVVVIGLDVLRAALPQLGWADAAVYREASPVVREIHAARAEEPVPPRVYRAKLLVLGDGSPDDVHAGLRPNSGMEAGIDHLDLYDAFKTPRELAFWKALEGQPRRLLDLTATRWAFLNDAALGRTPPPGMVVVHRYDGLGASLVHVEGVAPRAYLAQDAAPAADLAAAARAIAAPGFRPGASAVVEGGEARQATGACTLARYAPEAIELSCDASAPAYAIVADGWFPGWHARVNGVAAPVLPADVALRAVPVPAGASRVLLEYRPGLFGAGLALSALGLAACAALAWRGRRARNAS